MVYYTDGIPGAEALAAQKRLAVLLSYKLKRGILGNVWLCAGMDIASNSEV